MGGLTEELKFVFDFLKKRETTKRLKCGTKHYQTTTKRLVKKKFKKVKVGGLTEEPKFVFYFLKKRGTTKRFEYGTKHYQTTTKRLVKRKLKKVKVGGLTLFSST